MDYSTGAYPDYPSYGQEQIRVPGKVDVIEALGWAFKTVFRNKRVWILGSLLGFFVVGIFAAAVIMAVMGPGNYYDLPEELLIF
ncbi:hypothetical protein [Corynebacterium lowii]|uniref:Uncharacterized protein n=1 Tax=Corynebacterium lowii TaxID=1544413 RepID=A0A0Q1AIL8_9CORY|nr:hypothetical protein [Corynebacterium lowii]KQB86548.1 hypothetical protein Clow_00756 [Corynebacterium lowii]MDP9851229.1 hypothetical protein [Corynebacterium lowii]